jgi:hypothetical protein
MRTVTDRSELLTLGERLHGVGHRRRQLAESVLAAIAEGDLGGSRDDYEELVLVTSEAIELMRQQQEMLGQAIQGPP